MLVLSRLHPKKGLDVLIDAFLVAGPDAEVCALAFGDCGDGPADYVSKLKE